jgi:hypothetical protein
MRRSAWFSRTRIIGASMFALMSRFQSCSDRTLTRSATERHEQPHRLAEALLEDADVEVRDRVVALRDRGAADVHDIRQRVSEGHLELSHVRLLDGQEP